jgi:hypothetical protein
MLFEYDSSLWQLGQLRPKHDLRPLLTQIHLGLHLHRNQRDQNNRRSGSQRRQLGRMQRLLCHFKRHQLQNIRLLPRQQDLHLELGLNQRHKQSKCANRSVWTLPKWIIFFKSIKPHKELNFLFKGEYFYETNQYFNTKKTGGNEGVLIGLSVTFGLISLVGGSLGTIFFFRKNNMA